MTHGPSPGPARRRITRCFAGLGTLKPPSAGIAAKNPRSSKVHAPSTLAEHRPKSHQQYLEWTPMRIIEWAGKAGPFTARLVEAILAEKPHPEMGYRSALGVISLSRKYGPDRVEAACTRAVRLKIGRAHV